MTSCGDARPQSASGKPAEERVRPTFGPRIPDATTPCPTDATKLCNSDEETAGVIAGYDDALAKANRTICYMRVWLGFSPCLPDDP